MIANLTKVLNFKIDYFSNSTNSSVTSSRFSPFSALRSPQHRNASPKRPEMQTKLGFAYGLKR